MTLKNLTLTARTITIDRNAVVYSTKNNFKEPTRKVTVRRKTHKSYFKPMHLEQHTYTLTRG